MRDTGDDMAQANGPEIVRLRKNKGWSRKALAEFAELSYKTIARAEKSDPLRLNTIGDIAAALEIEPAYIMLGMAPSVSVLGAEARRDETPPRTPSASLEIAEWIRSFDPFIADRTRDFVGRDFVFKAVDDFLNDPRHASGYFLIQGDPGIGKSTLIAELIRRGVAPVYHFNVALQGINTARQFFGNVCARLIRDFGLPYSGLPDDFAVSSAFLSDLLCEAAATLAGGERLVLAIDALDEVDTDDRDDAANPLFLPEALPDGVYIVATARLRHGLGIQGANVRSFILKNDEENRADIVAFVASRTGRDGTRKWMKDHSLDKSAFLELMCDKSEGNFMYLRHVLPEIERGAFASDGTEGIPHGLRAYYRHHWSQMKRSKATTFASMHELVVCVLAAVSKAVSIKEVSDWTQIDVADVRKTIREWVEFLQVEHGESDDELYRVYHTEFRTFLQEEVDPGLRRFHAMIATAAMRKVGKIALE